MDKKPDYVVHRREKAATDSAVLATLLAAQGGRGLNLYGFTSIQGFVEFVAGTAPTVTIQPCELVKWKDYPAGVEQQKLVNRGAAIGPLSADEAFEVPTPGGGLWVLRIHAITGAPTSLSIYCAPGNRAPEGSI